MSKSHSQYKRNIKNTRDLNSLYNYINSNSPALDSSHLLRSEYALIISAFDTYIHDIVREKLSYNFFHGTISPKNPLLFTIGGVKSLVDAPTQIERELLLDACIQQAIGTSSFQSPKSVEYALSLIGVNKVWKKLSFTMGTSASDIFNQLSIIVNRRNKIVHEFDSDKITNALTAIAVSDVDSCYVFIDRLINAIEAIL